MEQQPQPQEGTVSLSSHENIQNLPQSKRKSQRPRKSKQKRYQPIGSKKQKSQLQLKEITNITQQLEDVKTQLEAIQEVTKCIICYEAMYRPTTLPCGHTACTACCLNVITYLPIGTPLNIVRKCALCRTAYLPGFNFSLNDKLRDVITTLHGEEEYITRGIQQMDEQMSFIQIQPHNLSMPANTTRFLKIVAYLLNKYILAFYTGEEVIKGWSLIIQYFNTCLPNWSVFTTDNILFHGPRHLKLNVLEDPRSLKSIIVGFPEGNLVYPNITDQKLLDMFWNSFQLNKHVAKVVYV